MPKTCTSADLPFRAWNPLSVSPVAKSMIEGGRRRVANRISPDAGFVTLTEIDDQTAIMERDVEGSADEALAPSNRRR